MLVMMLEAWLVKLGTLLLVLLFPVAERASPEPIFNRPRRDGLIAIVLIAIGVALITYQTWGHLRSAREVQQSAATVETQTLEPVADSTSQAPVSGANAASPTAPEVVRATPCWYDARWRGWTAASAWRQARRYALQLIPFAVILMVLRQSPSTLGLSAGQLGRAPMFGLALSLVPIFVYGPGWLGRAPALVAFSREEIFFFLGAMFASGFVEEITFRGFFQSRLVAWLGTWWGIGITVAFFTIVHLPFQLSRGHDAPELLWGLLGHAASGCVFSLAFHRMRNIVAPGLLHAFGNWAA